MPLFFVLIVAAHYLPSTSRNWHLPPKMRMPSTGDGRAGALFASWWGATSEGVTSTFWKNSFLGVPVRTSGIRCKKRGHKKRKTAGVMPLFSRSEIIFVVGAPFSTMYMPTELYRKGSETPHIITGIHRKSMQMNKKHISWEIEHMSSKSIFLCILRVNSITQCLSLIHI